MLDRARGRLQDQERWLLERFLCICTFVNPPGHGVSKIREILAQHPLAGYELDRLANALGHSRCEEAFELLREFGSNRRLLEQIGGAWINAVVSFGGSPARDLLLSFLDPAVERMPSELQWGQQEALAARIAELARSDQTVHARLLELCAGPLAAPKRLLLGEVIGRLDTSMAIVAGLDLIDDAGDPPVPWGLREGIERLFVERVPSAEIENAYTRVARPGNSIRAKLFEMVITDERRRKSAFSFLGQIEEWRLEHGRPLGEPRHPAFESGELWPPREPRA